MADVEADTHGHLRTDPITIRHVSLEQPWIWLAAGWRDLWRVPTISLTYGTVFFAISVAITAGLVYADLLYLLPPLIAGFMLVGPMLAVGCYEASRRLETGEPVRLIDVTFVYTRAPAQLAFVGALLSLFFLAWIRTAMLIFAIFYGIEAPPVPELVSAFLFTYKGLSFLAVGTAVGAVLAFVAFAVSVISVPMLMRHETDAVTAMAKSIEAVRRNFWPMMLWAWLIALLTVCGVATLYVGSIITLPLVGHATWHAYRSLIADSGPN
ncbi:MAG: hypothetical protein CMM50_07845 [Rhodospirillaceae bacterium]|nr:hypothetical protein [Rhodospirillaceae bacterium]